MNKLGIDVATRDAKRLIRELRRRKTTISAIGPFVYHQENTTCQVHVDTLLTERQLDDWLYRVHHKCDYVGVFERSDV